GFCVSARRSALRPAKQPHDYTSCSFRRIDARSSPNFRRSPLSICHLQNALYSKKQDATLATNFHDLAIKRESNIRELVATTKPLKVCVNQLTLKATLLIQLKPLMNSPWPTARSINKRPQSLFL